MGFCSNRSFLLTVCILQLICTFWRQVFDFLGYMWGPILANFFQIIFVIFGFFGACQYRAKYTIAYTIWSVLWCGWNIFVMCFYMSVGFLDRNTDILNLGTGSVSWWESNGPGCKASFLGNLTSLEETPWRPPRPDVVTGCFVYYHHLEAFQAVLHAFLAVLGIAGGISISHSLWEDDDHLPVSNKTKKPIGPPPLYSIEYTSRHRNDDDDDDEFSLHEVLEDGDSRLQSSRPMTPRRVKRRSVNSRGNILSTSGNNNALNPPPPPHYYHTNISSHRRSTHRSSTRSSGRRHKTPHQNPVTRLMEHQQLQKALNDSSTSAESTRGFYGGHCNPLYQQSSTHSLDLDCDRPPSARSTYSNYHGTRAFSYTGGIATPQVPTQSATSQVPYRHSSSFLSGGPPAYNLHGAVDSETVI
ncbi:sodium/potassium-transporting ATPase subunit beta-1-interacting protein [Lycorma delicatula]|uniref:sodium/potassium-transporting ATPase subunit beta-1-interacting protein n=1 Tax=Lycorma delicatula TaxID=130591 RepID=UPI003F51970A